MPAVDLHSDSKIIHIRPVRPETLILSPAQPSALWRPAKTVQAPPSVIQHDAVAKEASVVKSSEKEETPEKMSTNAVDSFEISAKRHEQQQQRHEQKREREKQKWRGDEGQQLQQRRQEQHGQLQEEQKPQHHESRHKEKTPQLQKPTKPSEQQGEPQQEQKVQQKLIKLRSKSTTRQPTTRQPDLGQLLVSFQGTTRMSPTSGAPSSSTTTPKPPAATSTTPVPPQVDVSKKQQHHQQSQRQQLTNSPQGSLTPTESYILNQYGPQTLQKWHNNGANLPAHNPSPQTKPLSSFQPALQQAYQSLQFAPSHAVLRGPTVPPQYSYQQLYPQYQTYQVQPPGSSESMMFPTGSNGEPSLQTLGSSALLPGGWLQRDPASAGDSPSAPVRFALKPSKDGGPGHIIYCNNGDGRPCPFGLASSATADTVPKSVTPVTPSLWSSTLSASNLPSGVNSQDGDLKNILSALLQYLNRTDSATEVPTGQQRNPTTTSFQGESSLIWIVCSGFKSTH